MKVYNLIQVECGSESNYVPGVYITTFANKEDAMKRFNEELDFAKGHYDEDDFEELEETKFVVIDQGEDQRTEFRVEETEVE